MNTKKHTTTKAQRRQEYRENAQRERDEETMAYGLRYPNSAYGHHPDGTCASKAPCLQLRRYARRHPLGAKQARGGKVTVTPMI